MSGHKCITSKGALLIMVWCISISLEFNSKNGEGIFLTLLKKYNQNEYKEMFFVGVYATNAVALCFYPLAGLLADNKIGRFKTIYQSSTFMLMFFILKGILYAIILVLNNIDSDDSVFAFAVFVSFMSLLVAITSPLFNANIIQFGVDQLQDSPTDHQSVFIHWYVWIIYVTVLIALAGSAIASYYNTTIPIIAQLAAPLSCSMVILCIVLLIVHYNKHWFIIDTARTNPYKLVYRVTKFARQHKVPIRRSAFTYCEDDIPSGLDLGKTKYGGPFTTEQVEDVKAFYGILKILFSLGIIFFLDIVSGPLFTEFAHIPEDNFYTYGNIKKKNLLQQFLLKKGLLSSSLVVIILPIYIIFIRPCCHHHLNMLRRIGIGIVLFILSVVCTIVTGATIHRNNSTQIYYMDSDWVANDIDSYMGEAHHYRAMALVPQQCLSALSVLFIYPALYEFICAQSPHSMKGLFIGLSFAIKGLFEFLSSVLFFLFLSLRSHINREVYYMVHLVVGVVSLAVYVYVARKYKLRERDEPCHVRRFVEDNYSKIPQEEHENLE